MFASKNGEMGVLSGGMKFATHISPLLTFIWKIVTASITT